MAGVPLAGAGSSAVSGAGSPVPGAGFGVLARLDALANRAYGSRLNPLYHSGAISVVLLLVLLLTGLYLLVFYRIGDPHASVVRLTEDVWLGGWVRSLHRYASAAALLAAVVHGFRMYAQRRTWGPRALAWVSGVVLVGVVLVSGWTGYVLVWDTHGQVLAVEGARLLDALPVFSEPIGRSFVGETSVPSAFFFVNLFAHIALPIGVGVLVWLHVARVARPVLVPARPVLWGAVAGLGVLAAVWPASLGPAADLLRHPGAVPLDWFYAFWLPVSQRLPAWSVWAAGTAGVALVTAVPWLTRPKRAQLPAPARVNERTCTGCEQCVRDCPYEAIGMVPRTDGRSGLVARVNPDLCTRCGICVGACPPMSIGPLALTARDQLREVREFLQARRPGPADVVMVGCTWSAARAAAAELGALYLPVSCVGAMHTSAVELLLRGGAGGVLVAGCAEHDGRTRDGVWLAQQRLFEGRPADLKPRVDRSRIRLVQASLGEGVTLHRAAGEFAAEIAALAGAGAEVDVIALCRRVQEPLAGGAEEVA